MLGGDEGRDSMFGGAGADQLGGGEDDDVMNGDWGADSLYGDTGNDSLNGGSYNDDLSGGDGSDWLSGGDGNDELWGNDGRDRLYGSDGNDTLSGGASRDILGGGRGADLYQLWEDVQAQDTIVLNAGGSGRSLSTIDRVEGFESGVDKIDLSGLGAMTFQALDYAGGNKASCYFDGTYLRIDTNGDRASDMIVEFVYVDTLRAGDFIFA
jgi:Ca2+-binding RTX toxin-like protein